MAVVPTAPEGLFVPYGEDRFEVCATGHILRYGSSLAIMSRASRLINAEFHSNPTKDWLKNAEGGRWLVYFTLETPTDETVCAMRTIVDGVGKDNVGRVIIEYVETAETQRCLGHARTLVDFLKTLATMGEMDLYVLALEDSCPYWLKLGFVLEQDTGLNSEFNGFTDTHLLKLPSNKTGSTETTYVMQPRPPDDDDDEEDEDEEEEESEEDRQAEGDVDMDLQMAIAASLH
eukprot:TRINITY_DN2078_c0_g1_i1.p1 TRINITY_DN2078_c0_g1~~TRINITY_DN2078_c0_g1_i1.p1  ORF type:complete len:243 (-),score=49.50 TRINITY_DN2078_c0_g1_i1:126-821(-)